MKYQLYKLTNKINGKFYYGVTNYWKRRKYQYDKAPKETTSAMVHAIRKYGWDNINIEVIKDGMPREEAYNLEKEMVTEQEVNNPMCYNLRVGGWGGSVKGRKGNRVGREPANKLISDDDGSDICEAYATGLFTQWELAKAYGLKSRAAICRVLYYPKLNGG